MVGLDNSILYTALPQLTQQLHATDMQQLWIINAYTLVLSGLLLGTGTLGDRIGHRLMFLIGLATFGTASLVAAYSPNAWLLIAARALLGLGAAIMLPSTLALIRLTFPNEVERNKAIGIWSSVAVVGAAAGPTVGGFLLEHFWWGSVFLINVPIVALAIILPSLLGPPNLPNPHKHWDFPSSFYALITLSSLVLAIKTAAATQINVALLVCSIAAFLLGAAAFAHRQTRLNDPLLTFDIFYSPTFTRGRRPPPGTGQERRSRLRACAGRRRGTRISSTGLLEALHHARDVSSGLHIVVGLADGAIRLHEESGTDNALDHLAVVLLLPEGAIRGHDGLIRIRKQREVEIVVIAELRQRLGLIGGDAYHRDIEGIELC